MLNDIVNRLAGASSAGIPALGFILLTATAALTAVLALYKLLSSTRRPKLIPNVPFAGVDTVESGSMEAARQRFLGEGAEMLAEGYRMTGGGFFYVPSPSVDRLMIPARYVEELKNAPDDQADFIGSFVEVSFRICVEFRAAKLASSGIIESCMADPIGSRVDV